MRFVNTLPPRVKVAYNSSGKLNESIQSVHKVKISAQAFHSSEFFVAPLERTLISFLLWRSRGTSK